MKRESLTKSVPAPRSRKGASLGEVVKQAGGKEDLFKVTFELDGATYKKLQHLALDLHKSNRACLAEAIHDFLAKHERLASHA
jgi:hypothetical protein